MIREICKLISECLARRNLGLGLSSVAKFLAIFEKCNFFFPECATYFTTVAFKHHTVKLCKTYTKDIL